jgi:hypothetical protein
MSVDCLHRFVGAWRSEQVQDVHELIAPVDRLSLVRRLPAVASYDAAELRTERLSAGAGTGRDERCCHY